jgi:aminoglycoside phosphotransferase (APT) family kinase protein
VHGDLWLGNVLWSQSDRITAVIDWDCAGRGPAGVDLGSARMDAVTAYGHGAEDDVLRGWEREAGRPADDVAHWDVIACLSTPPDMGWFTTAVQQQGRTDLTAELLVERRDDFLERALAALEA